MGAENLPWFLNLPPILCSLPCEPLNTPMSRPFSRACTIFKVDHLCLMVMRQVWQETCPDWQGADKGDQPLFTPWKGLARPLGWLTLMGPVQRKPLLPPIFLTRQEWKQPWQ